MSNSIEATPVPDSVTKINLGCGADYREGFWNVNEPVSRTSARLLATSEHDADEYVDLDDTPWPWLSNRFERADLIQVVEHFEDPTAALHEVARIVEPGGEVHIACPHPNSISQSVSPDHKSQIHPKMFTYSPLISPLFDVVEIGVDRVRFGRLLPESWALWFADHIGHIVSGYHITLEVRSKSERGGPSCS